MLGSSSLCGTWVSRGQEHVPPAEISRGKGWHTPARTHVVRMPCPGQDPTFRPCETVGSLGPALRHCLLSWTDYDTPLTAPAIRVLSLPRISFPKDTAHARSVKTNGPVAVGLAHGPGHVFPPTMSKSLSGFKHQRVLAPPCLKPAAVGSVAPDETAAAVTQSLWLPHPARLLGDPVAG